MIAPVTGGSTWCRIVRHDRRGLRHNGLCAASVLTMLPPMDSSSHTTAAEASWLEATTPHLPAVEALMHQLLEQHGGELLAGIAREHLATGGKRLRARLALAATAALGGVMAEAIGWAAACELLHNATLVHDDLQDGDRVRRGRPTVWVRHGQAQAINTGDLLFLVPFLAVSGITTTSTIREHLLRVLAARGAAIIHGQAAELRLTETRDTRPEAYLATVVGKTSGLFELPVVGAALLAKFPVPQAEELARAFRSLGVLFQIQDDILDLYGDKGRDAPGGDIREGKVSALVVEHLQRFPADRDWLVGVLAKPRADTAGAEVDEVIRRFREGGALAAVCRRLVDEAAALPERPGLAPALQDLVTELCERMFQPIQHVIDSCLSASATHVGRR
jgi:geranylgeranyl diphosphate synthase, type I